MKKIIYFLFAFLFSVQLYAQSLQQYSRTEMIIIFNPATPKSEIDSILEYFNMYIIEDPTTHIGATLVAFHPSGAPEWAGENPIDSINGVVEGASVMSIVDGVGLNYELENMSYSDSFSQLFSQGGQNKKCNILNVNQSNGGNPVSTAILDTGISSESDVQGNFFDPNNLGFNYIDPGFDPYDNNNHGTHISSIVMGGLDNVNEMIDLYAYKTHNELGVGTLFDAIQGIDDAIVEGMDIVNMSFSFYASTGHQNEVKAPLSIAIDFAKRADILCIASAGNRDFDNDVGGDAISASVPVSAYPASYDNENIISVASASCKRKKSSWSNYGVESVDVFAPGENISGLDQKGKKILISGTSQAAAYVTQLATYLATFQNEFDWELTKCAILTGVDDMKDTTIYVLSDGFVNSTLALDALLSDESSCHKSLSGNFFTSNGNGSQTIQKLRLLNRGDMPTFEITTDTYQQAEVIIANVLGEIVFSQTIELRKGIESYEFDFPKDDLLGVYFLSVRGAGEVQTLKFVR